MKYAKSTLAILLLIFSCVIHATPELFDNLELTCQQSFTDKQLLCDYRLIKPEPVLAISADVDGKTLPVTRLGHYPDDHTITAILLLVDTSDPGRARAIEAIRQHIERILNTAKNHHRIGLASFDRGLRLEVPIGISSEQILRATAGLWATGQTTELYRSLLTALELLAQVKADRKTIYLFSDGLAEDTAYFHDDVVHAARTAGVIITSLGYPRSVSQSVGLQTLRRLSEETGGLFIEGDNSFHIPDAFLDQPFRNIDNGGRIAVATGAAELKPGENYTVNLHFETDTGQYTVQHLLSVPGMAVAVAETPSATTNEKPATAAIDTAPAQPVKVITREAPEPRMNPWFWYGIPMFLVLLLVLALVALILANYRQGKKPANIATGFTEFRPYAYLVVQDETKKRYAITRTTWRIGRGKDNEMTLRDSSVSRRHAEIHRDKGDVFTIYDLESLNGVYVNNRKITRQVLHEGDIIEIGDIALRFTLLSTDYSLEDATAMQNTRTPMTH